MQRMLNKFRADLSVAALPAELSTAAERTIAHLESQSARVAIERMDVQVGRLEAEVSVENLGGHKLPTAYPSRRAWLRVVVRDAGDRVVFESGGLNANGSIVGNDNDVDAAKFEPHYTVITRPDEVQIYESVMGDSAGAPTTALLSGMRYLKDNRLLPLGFDKRTADKDIAVVGGAVEDDNFTAGGDRVRYSVALGAARGPFRIEVELWYQPIAYRWAQNLKRYDAMEPARFVGYYDSMAQASGVMLGKASATAR